MKKINVKKALASVAALSVVACMAAVPASAAEHTFATSAKKGAVTIEQITVSVDELADANYKVPVLVKVKPNPGVNAVEFGVKCALEYETVNAGKTAKTYADLATAGADVADGLDVKMTCDKSDVIEGLTWCAWADSEIDDTMENFLLLLVTVPSDAKAGDKFPIEFAEEGAPKADGSASPNIFKNTVDKPNVDYVADAAFEGVDGFIQIEGGTTEATTTTTEETTTTTEETTTTTEETTTTTSTQVTTTTTQTQATTTTTNGTTTTGATTAATTTTKAATSTGSPKTGASDVLPIAGAAAAVAVLGGVALVAKKKND